MIEPEAKPDADYTTQQAANLCGISINTLLAWERRYGVPSPRRNDRDERIYSTNDLRTIRWLQEQTAQGTPIGQAVHRLPEMDRADVLIGSPNDDVVVTLDISRLSPPAIGAQDETTSAQSSIWQRDLSVALIGYDRSGVSRLLSTAALETSPLVATERVVLPTMQSLIQRYDAGNLDLAVLKTADRWLSTRIAHWLDNATPDRDHARTTVLLVASDAVWTSVPMLAYAMQLVHEGHHVIDLPAGSPVETVHAVVTAITPSRLIFLSDAVDRRAEDARIDILRTILPPSVTISRVIPDWKQILQGANGRQTPETTDNLRP